MLPMSSRIKVVPQLESFKSVKPTLPPASRIVWHGTVGMPHQQERPSQADDVPRETIIAVRHPPLAPQCLPYALPELVVRHLNPVRPKPVIVQLDMRHLQRPRNLPRKRRLPRSRRSRTTMRSVFFRWFSVSERSESVITLFHLAMTKVARSTRFGEPGTRSLILLILV